MTTALSASDEIVALERSFWDAMKRKDGARAAELCAPVSLVAGQQGVMSIDKAKMGEMTETGEWTLQDYAFEDVKVATPTPDIAVIAYKVKQTVTLKGEPRSFEAADSSTWVRGENGWECCLHTETILGDGKAGSPA